MIDELLRGVASPGQPAAVPDAGTRRREAHASALALIIEVIDRDEDDADAIPRRAGYEISRRRRSPGRGIRRVAASPATGPPCAPGWSSSSSPEPQSSRRGRRLAGSRCTGAAPYTCRGGSITGTARPGPRARAWRRAGTPGARAGAPDGHDSPRHGGDGCQADYAARGDGGDLQRGLSGVDDGPGERGRGDEGQDDEHDGRAAASGGQWCGQGCGMVSCPSPDDWRAWNCSRRRSIRWLPSTDHQKRWTAVAPGQITRPRPRQGRHLPARPPLRVTRLPRHRGQRPVGEGEQQRGIQRDGGEAEQDVGVIAGHPLSAAAAA